MNTNRSSQTAKSSSKRSKNTTPTPAAAPVLDDAEQRRIARDQLAGYTVSPETIERVLSLPLPEGAQAAPWYWYVEQVTARQLADTTREATAWVESAIINLASVVSFIDSSRDDDPTMARESLADALDSLVAARIELNVKPAAAVKVQS